ncbi:MAG: NlpC/P60 family protein [Chthonomonadales bacterium]
MKIFPLRSLVLGALIALQILSAGSAQASKNIRVGHGDSVDSLARKYHVAKKDIAKANHISEDAVLRDGRKLIIPDPPKTVKRGATMHRVGVIRADRIAVRLGPNESYRRAVLVDRGYQLVVTRKAGEWYQVTTQTGRIGWVRNDFLALGKNAPTTQVASHNKKNKTRLARHNSDDEQPRSSRRSKRSRRVIASHHRARYRVAVHHRSRRSKNGRPEADAPETESEVVQTAYAYRGTPYHFGGTSKSGFDCSGLTQYVYKKKGVSLPRTAAEQFNKGKKVSGGKMKPGDLVFFHTTRKGVSHVGVYAGEGKFVHASSGGGKVRVDSLNSGYYHQRLVGARRVE